MARLCERPGCSDRGAVAYGFDADRLLVWLAAFDPDVERTPRRRAVQAPRRFDGRAASGGRSTTHAIRKPPLFKAPRATAAQASTASPADHDGRASARRAGRRAPVADRAGHTVAELSGAEPDDPDATVAMPWMPVFDVRDDLDGLLRAESPLLARAFQGSARPR